MIASTLVRQLFAGDMSGALASASLPVLVVVAAATAILAATAWRMARRGSSLPVALLVGLLAAVLVLGGTWKLRGVARDVRSDRQEAITRVLEVRQRSIPDGPSRAADLWAVGDGADGRPASAAVVRLMASTDPDAILQLGDVYGPYAAYMDKAYGALAARVHATPGNHDWHQPKRIAEYLSYWESRPQGRALFYSYRVAGWEVLSLNSELPQQADSAQFRWMRQQLQAPGDCRIAFFHRPRYSAGRHGDQADMEGLWQTMRGHVALVLNGHDHDMQLLHPIGGTTEMVVGSGGHGHYRLHNDPKVAFGDDTHDGALHLELAPGSVRYSFVAVDGTVLKTGQLACVR